ncbi:MAG: RNA polymerase sigma factor [Actinobacteria bacterium]|nr:RNA polymerase sigma factor [Actinomycetota bacterium]
MRKTRLSERSETALLRAARSDPEAFCEFYDRNARALLGWLVAQTHDLPAAMDIAAETFAVALRSLTSFRGERPASGRAWLYGIALRLLIRYREGLRHERSARERIGLREEPYFDEAGIVHERLVVEQLRPELQRALAELPEYQRDALKLRIVGELDYGQVAAQLDCTPVAARLRVSRALRTLRTILEGAGR